MTSVAPTLVPLPANWAEVSYPTDPNDPNDPTGNEIDESLDFLKNTYGWRYPNLDYEKTRKKTKTRTQSNGVRSVRIFVRRTPGGAIDMCTYFFLRLKKQAAYCLTVGVAAGINSNNLDSDVRQVCRHLKSLPGPNAIDVVNDRKLPGDLQGSNETARSKIVGAAFQAAQAGGVFPTEVYPFYVGDPWPPTLYRYPAANPIP